MEDVAVATWCEVSGGKLWAPLWVTPFPGWSFSLLWYPFYCRKQSPALLSQVKLIAVCQILWYAKVHKVCLGTQKRKPRIVRDFGLELDQTWPFETQELEFMDIQWSVKDKSFRVGAFAQCLSGVHEVLVSIPSVIPFHGETQDLLGWSSGFLLHLPSALIRFLLLG